MGKPPCWIAVTLCLLALAPRTGRGDELETLARAVADRPDDAEARERYARAAIQRGRADEAISTLKDGIARLPDFVAGYYLLAAASRARGASLEAAVYYRACMAIGQQREDALLGLGRSLAALGETAAARQALRDYVAAERRADMVSIVESARRELAALDGEGSARTDLIEPAWGRPRPASGADRRMKEPDEPAGRGDDDDDRVVDPWQRPWQRARRSAANRGGAPLRDLRDPFAQHDPDDLLGPEAALATEVLDGDGAAAPAAAPAAATADLPASVREYAGAVGAYRRALAAQAERVAARYERGLGLALSGRSREAAALWDGLAFDDADVAQAKRKLERLQRRGR